MESATNHTIRFYKSIKVTGRGHIPRIDSTSARSQLPLVCKIGNPPTRQPNFNKTQHTRTQNGGFILKSELRAAVLGIVPSNDSGVTCTVDNMNNDRPAFLKHQSKMCLLPNFNDYKRSAIPMAQRYWFDRQFSVTSEDPKSLKCNVDDGKSKKMHYTHKQKKRIMKVGFLNKKNSCFIIY